MQAYHFVIFFSICILYTILAQHLFYVQVHKQHCVTTAYGSGGDVRPSCAAGCTPSWVATL